MNGRNSPPQAQPEASTREVLAGLVERVTFHNAENGFCVLRIKARGHRDLVTAVGHAATISAGEWITAALHRRDPWQATGRTRRTEEGARHCRAQRVGTTAVVETERMVGSTRSEAK